MIQMFPFLFLLIKTVISTPINRTCPGSTCFNTYLLKCESCNQTINYHEFSGTSPSGKWKDFNEEKGTVESCDSFDSGGFICNVWCTSKSTNAFDFISDDERKKLEICYDEPLNNAQEECSTCCKDSIKDYKNSYAKQFTEPITRSDGWGCIAVSSANAIIEEDETGKKIFQSCENGFKWIQKNDLGVFLSHAECQPLSKRTFPNTLRKLEITKSFNFLENPSVPNAYSTVTLNSALFKTYENIKDNLTTSYVNRQILANMCVLQMYNPATTQCQDYINYSNSEPISVNPNLYPGFKQKIPWLYYDHTLQNATAILTNTDKIDFEVSFISQPTGIEFRELEFFMSKFTLNGTLVGIERWKNEFIMCSDKENNNNYTFFGNEIHINCYIDLWTLFNRTEQMFFYDVFIRDPVKDQYFDVPLWVSNIENENGTPTWLDGFRMNNETTMDNYIWTRRMFWFDNLSGIPSTSDPQSNPYLENIVSDYITYAKEIKIIIRQRPNEKKIYLPFIQIFYSTRARTHVNTTRQAYVSFKSEYSGDTGNFLTVMLVLLILYVIIVLLIVAYRMYVWMKVNPADLMPGNFWVYFAMHTVLKICKFFGIFTFYFTLIISGYWYIFYKAQFRFFLLLPSWTEENYNRYYKKFDILFGIGWACYMIFMFYRIAAQVNFDIFFIDWEHEKELFTNNIGNNIESLQFSSHTRYRGAWRLWHVANQFNALQRKRMINIYFCMCWWIILIHRAGWSKNFLHVPTPKIEENAPINWLLRHFLASIIVFVVGFVEFALIKLWQIWIPLKKMEFLDLCSVSNISVFILDEQWHGYYIHGRSPSGKADSNWDELLTFWEDECKGKIRSRGINEGENEEVQCYEMYLSYAMRMIYDGWYYLQTETMLAQGKKNNVVRKQSKLASIFKYFPIDINSGNINMLNNYMNNQWKTKVEKIASNSREYIKEKTMIERVLEYPPENGDPSNVNTKEIVFYRDPGLNFDEVLFGGMEWDWFVMNVFLFQMWMRVLDSFEISIFLTFVCEQIWYYIRMVLGEKNLAKKSVIDERFFV